MVERVHAVGIEIDARLDVPNERVLGETVPEAGYDIVELARAAIALVVVQVVVLAEVERGVRVGRRHDVPAGAASADMVERREAARGIGPVIAGSPATVADQLEGWIDDADLDGFNLAFAVRPETFGDVADLLAPELQRRGRYKKAYEPGTLREKLFGPARLGPEHPAAEHRWS